MTTSTISAAATIEGCLQDLCLAIIDDSEVQSARSAAEAFLADEQGVALYRELMTLGRELHQREHTGEAVSDEEADRFAMLRSKADRHEGIASFTEAQNVLQNVADKVTQCVTKTLQNGRIPTAEELDSGGCCGGGGCGCH